MPRVAQPLIKKPLLTLLAWSTYPTTGGVLGGFGNLYFPEFLIAIFGFFSDIP
jgi:hypothetical protein